MCAIAFVIPDRVLECRKAVRQRTRMAGIDAVVVPLRREQHRWQGVAARGHAVQR